MDERAKGITNNQAYNIAKDVVLAREADGLALMDYETIAEFIFVEQARYAAGMFQTGEGLVPQAAPQQTVTQTGGARPETEIAPKPCPSCGSAVEDQTSVVAAMKKKNPKAKTPPKWSCTNEACPGGSAGYTWGSWDDWPKEWG